MRLMILGIAIVLLFMFASTGLSYLYPSLVWVMSVISFCGSAIGGSVAMVGFMEWRDR